MADVWRTSPNHPQPRPLEHSLADDPPSLAPAETAPETFHSLSCQANQAVVVMSQASQEFASALLIDDEALALQSQEAVVSAIRQYQEAVQGLAARGFDYSPPMIPDPSAHDLIRQAHLRRFAHRLHEAQGKEHKALVAKLQNHFEALGLGVAQGLETMWHALKRFLDHPVHEANQAFVDAASLLLHPIRNLTRALESLERFGEHSLDEQLMTLGEELPQLATWPLLIPLLAHAKGGIRHSQAIAERHRLFNIAQEGIEAPPGRTPVGSAVNRAVWGTHQGTVSRERVFTCGEIEAVWINELDGRDDGIHQVCELIRREAFQQVCLQTYIFDYDSPAAVELLTTLADKQHADPQFRIHLLIDHLGNAHSNPPGLHAILNHYGLKADVAAARPFWSRRGAHTKMFVLDGRLGVIGGNNIDNPVEKDLLVLVRGPVVQSLLDDFDDAWLHAVQHLAGPRTPPSHPPDPSPSLGDAIPMTLLTKKGMLGIYAKDYEHNDADQGLLAAMGAARESILIESPNLNADSVLHAIRQAAERGVQVKLCLPLDYLFLSSSLDATNNRAFLSFWAQLPEPARQQIDLRNFSSNGVKGESNHTKFVGIDHQWVYVGSQNMDNQSFAFSRELGLGLDDPETARRLISEIFEPDWKTSLPVSPGFFDRLIPYAFFDH